MTAIGWQKIIFVFVLLSLGCSKEENRAPAPAAPVAAAPTAQLPTSISSPGQGVGMITGRVVFKGGYTPGKVTISKDKQACGDSKLDPAMVIGSEGEVKNAVIQIAGLRQSSRAVPDAVFDQVKCEYAPHVLVVPVGGKVKIKNSDGILHNVHTFSEKNTPFNRAQPKYLKEISEKFTKPELVSVRCDVHGWMSGWIVVTENSFFDVTAADGSFSMENVPVGKYTLDVWHETLGRTSQSVEVKSAEVTNVTFEFQVKK